MAQPITLKSGFRFSDLSVTRYRRLYLCRRLSFWVMSQRRFMNSGSHLFHRNGFALQREAALQACKAEGLGPQENFIITLKDQIDAIAGIEFQNISNHFWQSDLTLTGDFCDGHRYSPFSVRSVKMPHSPQQSRSPLHRLQP